MNKIKSLAIIVSIVVILFFGIFIFKSKSNFEKLPRHEIGDFSYLLKNEKVNVILFGTSWCNYCQMTKDYLNSKSIPFKYYDIETSEVASEMHKKINGSSIPTLVVGKNLIRGYNPDLILKTFNELE